MNATHSRRVLLAAFGAALAALTLAAAGAARGTPSSSPVVVIHDGSLRGVAVPGGYAFRGLPYAAPPTGDLRWRPPQPPAAWQGVRDASGYAPSCLQKPSLFRPPGPES